MKSIGLKSETLFEIGITEHLSCLGEKLNSVNNDNDIPQNLKSMMLKGKPSYKLLLK